MASRVGPFFAPFRTMISSGCHNHSADLPRSSATSSSLTSLTHRHYLWYHTKPPPQLTSSSSFFTNPLTAHNSAQSLVSHSPIHRGRSGNLFRTSPSACCKSALAGTWSAYSIGGASEGRSPASSHGTKSFRNIYLYRILWNLTCWRYGPASAAVPSAIMTSYSSDSCL